MGDIIFNQFPPEAGIMLLIAGGGLSVIVLGLLGGWGGHYFSKISRIMLFAIGIPLFLFGFVGLTVLVLPALGTGYIQLAESITPPTEDLASELPPEPITTPPITPTIEEDGGESGSLINALVLIGFVVAIFFVFRTDRRKPVILSLYEVDELQDGKPYISIEVHNGEKELIKCHAVLLAAKYLDTDITREIVLHTNRLSWSGGEDEKIGIKHIDGEGGVGTLNIATRKDNKTLTFETAKGPREHAAHGVYTVDLEVRGTIGKEQFRPIPKRIVFEFLDESGEQVN